MISYSKKILFSLFLGIVTLTAEAKSEVVNLDADLVHYKITAFKVTIYTSNKYEPDVKSTIYYSGTKIAEELEEKYGIPKGELTDFSNPYSRLYVSRDRDIFVRKTNDDEIQVIIMRQSTKDINVI